MFAYDCVVIGNGPAGLMTAVYLRRFKRKCLLIGTGKPRAAWIPKTHNLIGYPKGISGRHLLKNMLKQARDLKTPMLDGKATLSRVKDGFKVKVGHRTLTTRTAVIATGFTDVQPKLKNLNALRRKGLLRYCPVCDAYEYRKKYLAVLVQDTDGVQRALFLKRFTSELLVIGINGFRFSKVSKSSLKKGGVAIAEGTLKKITVSKDRGRKRLSLLISGSKKFDVDAVYIELGCIVNDSAFKQIKNIRKAKSGFLIASPEQKLSVKGLYAVGDCVNNLGQLSVSAGQAAIAATNIHNELD